MTATVKTIGVVFALAAATIAATLAMADREAPLAPVSDYILAKGKTVLAGGDHEKAQDLFEQAVTAHPRNAKAFAYLGDAHLKAERGEIAKKYYDTALSINPDELHALLRSGEYALTKDDKETAEKHLKRLSWLCERRCAEFRTLKKAVDASNAKQKTAKAKDGDKKADKKAEEPKPKQ